jgi:hypothetical protein
MVKWEGAQPITNELRWCLDGGISGANSFFGLLGLIEEEESHFNEGIYPLDTQRGCSKKIIEPNRTGALWSSWLPHVPLSLSHLLVWRQPGLRDPSPYLCAMCCFKSHPDYAPVLPDLCVFLLLGLFGPTCSLTVLLHWFFYLLPSRSACSLF